MKIAFTSIDSKPSSKFYGSESVYKGGKLGKTFQGQSDLVGGRIKTPTVNCLWKNKGYFTSSDPRRDIILS